MTTNLSPDDTLALAIGKVTMAWNGAQHMLFLIFQEISGMKHEAAEAVFFTLKSDAAQRDIVAAAAQVVWADPKEAANLAELKSLIKRLGKHAEKRNETVHTMWEALFTWDDTMMKRSVVLMPRLSPKTMASAFEDPPRDYAGEYAVTAEELSVLGRELLEVYMRLRSASNEKLLEQDLPQISTDAAGGPPSAPKT